MPKATSRPYFVRRSFGFLCEGGTAALVTATELAVPDHATEASANELLKPKRWHFVAQLGPWGVRALSAGHVVRPVLFILN